MNFFKNRPLAICCFIFLCVYYLSYYLPPWVKLIIIAVSVVVGVVFFRRRLFVTVCSLSVAAACVFGYFYYDVHVSNASEMPCEATVEFEVLDISFSNDSIAYVDGKSTDGYKVHYTVLGSSEISAGDVIRGEVVYKNIEQTDDFDVERYYNSKDIWLEAEVENPETVGHNDSIIRNFISSVHGFCADAFSNYTNEETSGILSALSIGDRSELDESITRDFRRAGLSHMLAISGMHLSVIMGCIVMFADLFSLDKRWSSAVVIVICICYIFIAGASSSILRAGIMFIIMSMGSLFRRPSDSLTNLMLSVTLIVLFSPSAVFDTGLILSFTATLGIIVVVGKYMRKVKNERQSLLGKLWSCILISLITTLSAHAFSFIPLLLFFDSFSVISILSNLLISPVITVILFAIPLFLAVSKIPLVAAGIGYALDLVTGVMIWTVAKIAAVPNALVELNYPFVPFTLISIAVGIVFIFVFKKRNAYLMPYLCWFVTFIVAFSVYNINLSNKCDVVMYSEASSDAVIMRNSKGCIYLDLGKGSASSEKRAFKVIKDELYVNELDCWVITDYSNSIIKSANEHMNEFYIRNIYVPTPYDDVSKAAAEELKYNAGRENVNIVYYDYSEVLTINNIKVCINEPVRFEESSVSVPSAQIEYGGREISYVGCGYFDYGDPYEAYDILYMGECGTKRKQKESPHVTCNASFVAENNEVASKNIENDSFFFTDKDNRVKIRISR